MSAILHNIGKNICTRYNTLPSSKDFWPQFESQIKRNDNDALFERFKRNIFGNTKLIEFRGRLQRKSLSLCIFYGRGGDEGIIKWGP